MCPTSTTGERGDAEAAPAGARPRAGGCAAPGLGGLARAGPALTGPACSPQTLLYTSTWPLPRQACPASWRSAVPGSAFSLWRRLPGHGVPGTSVGLQGVACSPLRRYEKTEDLEPGTERMLAHAPAHGGRSGPWRSARHAPCLGPCPRHHRAECEPEQTASVPCETRSQACASGAAPWASLRGVGPQGVRVPASFCQASREPTGQQLPIPAAPGSQRP